MENIHHEETENEEITENELEIENTLKVKTKKSFLNKSELLTIANLIFLVGNLIIVFYGIKVSDDQYNMTVTSNYIQRYNSAELTKSKIVIKKYFLEINTLSKEGKRKELKRMINSKELEDIELDYHIGNLCNLFTEIGVSYRAGIIDRKVLFSFNAIVPKYWKLLEDYIAVSRDRAKPRKIFTSFEYLNDYIEENPFWIDGKLSI